MMEQHVRTLKKERTELLARAESAESWREHAEKQREAGLLKRVEAAEKRAEEMGMQLETHRETASKALAQYLASKADVRQYDERVQALEKSYKSIHEDRDVWRTKAAEVETRCSRRAFRISFRLRRLASERTVSACISLRLPSIALSK